MDQPRTDRQHPPDRLDGLGRCCLPAGAKVEVADLDLERRHGRRIRVADGAGPTISTHVLDTELGLPAEGIRVALYRLDVGRAPIRMTQALTDADGRIRDLLERPLAAGDYRLEFDIGREDDAFFRRIAVDLRIADTNRSYHVPLLVAPYSMTTYRGS
ncbi:MAG: hydroxyisourate hydrolase [Chloroflexi bacterium]|nr:hydroxyisourate hydrolase [Chloroflexota bacterium]